MFRNYFLHGAEQASDAAMFNKTFAYLDDLSSLLFSPVSLRFHVEDADYPNVVEQIKGRAAAAKLRAMSRQSDTDTVIGEANLWSLVKGKTFLKQKWERGGFSPRLIQPEAIGVFNESHLKLDQDMEAFVHSYLVTTHQFARMVWSHPNRDQLIRKVKRLANQPGRGIDPAMGAMKQVIIGGNQPFRAAGGPQSGIRGIVDWMGGTSPQFAPEVLASMIVVDEVWIWDDRADDWATLKIVGDDMLLNAHTQVVNEFAFDTATVQSNPTLKGKHPFIEFCPNRLDGYFWGRSEIINVALLQEAVNSRLNGINRMLRLQEEPPTKFTGTSGVNQQVISRFRKPGGYFVDGNPNAKAENVSTEIPSTLFASLQEYERMFDEMGGIPQLGKAHGVRSQGHAETLIRSFSARFKDRAVLTERSVEECGALMLDMARVYVEKKLLAWVPEEEAGPQAGRKDLEGLNPPAPGLVPVPFRFHDLDDDVSVTVDAHSSSPAFSADAKALAFDLFKIGAMAAEDVVEHSDVTDPEALVAGIQRRAVAKARAEQKEQELKLISGGKK